MENFPPNSRAARSREREKIERVTSADAVRRKRSLGRQFKHTFFGGDAHTAWHYTILNVLIPSVQDMIIEAVSAGTERLVRGEHRYRGTGPYRPYVNYRGFSSGRSPYEHPDDRPPRPGLTRPSNAARARNSFDEIIIPSRQEAEEVIDRLYDLISKYDVATVADLYELTGIDSTHTDHTWGWSELRGASVGRVRGGGYVLNLPDPDYI